MCGNFELMSNYKKTKDLIPKVELDENFEQDKTFFPSSSISVVQSDYSLNQMKWGLIPVWAKESKIGNSMFNARKETLLEKKSFSPLLEKNRCVIISSGYFEWKAKPEKKHKQKYRVSIPDMPVFAFAGLWTKWVDKETGEIIKSATIITTEPNELLANIHHRMPVILNKNDINFWLDTKNIDFRNANVYLKQLPSESFLVEEVST